MKIKHIRILESTKLMRETVSLQLAARLYLHTRRHIMVFFHSEAFCYIHNMQGKTALSNQVTFKS